ncbi:MAG: hydroxysqualene dehydroxylase HpnE, partial [Gammaproteobacteria bacterium]|nr:hydroxysqualene dehydroxylase HpnE [Gammaproteobacteria bacterium]
GGWAGLAAAIELTHQGIPVTLIESAKSCGGRARRVSYRDAQFDNGQHLLIGAYHETLRLLAICGVNLEQQIQRSPLHFTFYGDGKEQRSIRLPRLPAPLHMAAGIVLSRGMSWSTKMQLISASLKFLITGFRIKEDCSVDQLLQWAGQKSRTIKALWEPLCIATLNNPTPLASAKIFLRVLRDAFTQSYKDSDTLLCRDDLSSLFVDPAIKFIRDHGGEVLNSTRVNAIEIESSGIHRVVTDNTTINATNIILATPPSQAALLLEPLTVQHPQLTPLVKSLRLFEYQPIITLYLQYGETCRLPQPFVGFDGTLVQWLFDHSHFGRPGMMAAVISAEGEHSGLSREQIIQTVTGEISEHFADLGEPKQCWLIHEKRATFASTVDIDQIRPVNQTPIPGLSLAGDYTATGYPATLEGALMSGVASAHEIID